MSGRCLRCGDTLDGAPGVVWCVRCTRAGQLHSMRIDAVVRDARRRGDPVWWLTPPYAHLLKR